MAEHPQRTPELLAHYFAPKGPGAALALLQDGHPPRVECVGLADLETDEPISETTRFELASASKWFTATAVMHLVEGGEIALDAPTSEYLPELIPAAPRSRPLRVEDLLSHTSGLPDYLASGIHTPAEEMSLQSVLERLPAWAEQAQPGRAFDYSNTNYVALAQLVEAVTQLPFEDFLRDRLFRPHGLRDTDSDPARRLPFPIARGYQNLGYGLPHFEAVADPGLDTQGDGGIVSSLRDLIRWQELFWRGEIVHPESVERMQQPGTLDSGEGFPYGLGLQVETSQRGSRWIGHGGSWTSSTTLLGRYPEDGVSVLVLSNELMAPVERISQRAKEILSC